MHFICKLLSIILLLCASICSIIYAVQGYFFNISSSKNHVNNQNDNQILFLKADSVQYDNQNQIIEALGNVIILNNGYLLRSNRVIYNKNTREFFIYDKINVTNPLGHLITGNKIIFNQDFSKGSIDRFASSLNPDIIITGSQGFIISKNQYFIEDIYYTPCPFCYNTPPLWQINAKSMNIDMDNHKISYKNATFKIKNVPVLFLPYFSHPAPNSPAKSGILLPSIQRNSIKIPIYFRILPNLDLTVTPVFQKDYLINELELRHLIKYGEYKVNINYKHFGHSNNDDGEQYYFSSKGKFRKDHLHFLFNLERSSDQSFIKNYYGIHKPYLMSQAELNYIQNSWYSSLRGVSVQNFNKLFLTHATKKVSPILELDSTYNLADGLFLDINNNTSYFPMLNTHNSLLLNILSARLYKTFITYGGHIFNLSGYNRLDILHADNNKDLITTTRPEIWLEWRYPLMRQSYYTTYVSPKILFIVDFMKSHRKEYFYNKSLYSTNFIFNNNYINYVSLYSQKKEIGFNNYELGNRVIYGIESDIINNTTNIFQKTSFFLGSAINFTSIHKYQHKFFPLTGNIDIVFNPNIQFNYNFYKIATSDFKFIHLKDIFSTKLSFNKLKLELDIFNLNKVNNFNFTNKKIDLIHQSQIYIGIGYKFSHRWSAKARIRLDKLNSTLLDKFEANYTGKCANLSLVLSNDYTFDSLRHIFKQKNNISVSLGLSTIN